MVGRLGLRAAQLHGDYSVESTARVAAQVDTTILAIAANGPGVDTVDDHDVDVVMLDAATPGGGVPFDWNLVGDISTRHPILLAGGLGPDNVAAAIRRV